MANNVASYIKNLGKSVVYSAVDEFKREIAPNTVEFIDTNKDLFKEIYSAARDMRKTMNRAKTSIVNTKLYEAADVGWNTLQDSIRTGKFYDMERQKEIELSAWGETGDMDLGGFDDFDDSMPGFDDEDDDWGSLSDVGKGDIHISNTVEQSAKISSKVISDTVAKTGKYIADTQKASTHMMYMQNLNMISAIKTGMGDVHNSIGAVYKVNESLMEFHNKNTLQYYNNTTKILEEQNAMLKQLVDMQTQIYGPKNKQASTSGKLGYDDVAIGGIPNISEYFKLVGQNIKNKTGSFTDMMSMGGDGNMLLAWAANPLKFVSDFIAKSLTPAAVRASAKNLDASLSGLFAGLMSRMNYRAERDGEGSIAKILNDIFGIRNNINKTGVDVSKYEKGPVPFDGLTRKTIIDVIPGYLRKIESLLSGKGERIFNYESGRWQDAREIKIKFDRQEENAINDAFSDIFPEIENYMKKIKISDKRTRDDIMKGISEIAKGIFESGGYYDPYMDDNVFDKDDKSPEAIFNAVIRAMGESNTDRNKVNNLPRKVYESIASLNKQRSGFGEFSEFRELNNNSNTDSTVKRNSTFSEIIEETTGLLGNPLTIADKFGNNVYYYLQNMYRELFYIRNGAGGVGGSVNISTLKDPITKTILPKTPLEKKLDQVKKANELYEKSEETRAINAKAKGNTLYDFDTLGAHAITSAARIDIITKYKAQVDEEKTFVEKTIDKWTKDNPEYLYNNDNTKKSFLDALLDAGSIGEKFKVISTRINDLTKHPGDLLAGIITTADQKVYELIYGSEQKDSNGKPIKGFLDALINKMEITFDNFNRWLDENVLKKLKNKLGLNEDEGLLKQLMRKAGIDVDGIGEKAKNFVQPYKDSIKNVFGSAWRYTKDSVKDVYGSLWAKSKSLIGNQNAGDIQTNYDGRLITESGLTAISEGEMIIPSELNPLNPNRSRTNKKRERSNERAIVRKAKALGFNNISMHADGAASVGSQPAKNDITFSNMMYTLFGDEQTTRKAFNINTKESLNKVKQYAPETVATGLLGSGIGLLTGAIGGPLIGAAAGAAVGLAKQSKTIQTALFGEEVVNDDGTKSRDGGIISKEIQDFFKSDKFKDLAKFGVTGAVTGLFTPLGPVGGLIVGSSIAYAKNNAKISEALFGDVDGLFNKDRKEAIKKAFPKMAAGAAAGILLGPFGLVGNAMLGSAAGFAVTSDKFKELLFGVEDEDGEYRGGLLGGIRDHIILPIKNFGKDFTKKTEDFIVNDLIKPITGAVDPILEEIKYGIKNIFIGIPKAIDKLFNNALGIPLSSFINEKFIAPASKLLGGTFKALINPAKFLISAPSKMIGGIGNMYKMKQIRQGRANYMSAKERIKFRNEHMGRGLLAKLHVPGAAGLLGGPMFDSYAGTDEAIADMEDEEINAIRELLETATNSDKYYEKQVIKERNRVGSKVDSIFNDSYKGLIDNNARTRILRAINAGKIDTAEKLIANLTTRKGNKLTKEQQQKFLNELKPLANNLLDTRSRRDGSHKIENDTFAELRNKYGLNKLNRGNMSKYLDMFDKESSYRKGLKTPETEILDQEKKTTEAVEKQTDELVKMIKDTNRLLTSIWKEEPVEDTISNESSEESSENSERTTYFPIKKRKRNLLGRISDRLKGTRINPETGVEEIRSTDGTWIAKDSEEGQKIKAEQEQKNSWFTGISEKLGNMAGGLSDFLTRWRKDKDDEEKQPWWKKMLGYVGKTFGFFTLLGFVPKIYNWLKEDFVPATVNTYNERVLPWLNENIVPKLEPISDELKTIGNFLKNTFYYVTGSGDFAQTGGLRGDIGKVFTEYVFPWLGGTGRYNSAQKGLQGGLPATFRDIIIPHYVGGIQFLLSDIVPAIGKVLLQSLPGILRGTVKGIGNILSWKMSEIFPSSGNTPMPKEMTESSKSTFDFGKLFSKDYATGAGFTLNQNTSIDVPSVWDSTTSSQPYSSEEVSAVEDRIKELESKPIKSGKEKQELLYLESQLADMNKANAEAAKKDKGGLGGILGNIFALDGQESLGEALLGAAGRSALTGNGLPKAIQGIFKKAGIAVTSPLKLIPGIGNAAQKGVLKVGGSINAGFEKLAGSGISSKLKTLLEPLTASAKSVGKTGLNLGKSVVSGIGDIASELTEGASKGLISKFKDVVSKGLNKLFNAKTVKDAFVDGLMVGFGKSGPAAEKQFQNASDKVIKKITTELAEKLAKATGKTLAKAAAFVASGGIVAAGFAVADFISGYRNANTIMGVTEATFVEKIICGLFKAINGAFCLGLLPEAYLMDLITDTILPFFGFDMADLADRKSDAQRKVDEFNEYNDTNLTLEEYNNKDKWTTKIKNFVGEQLNKVKNWFNGDSAKTTTKTTTSTSSSKVSTSNTKISYSAKGKFGRGKHLSQLDSAYNMRFNVPGDSYTQYMSDSGCGPVAAATVINGLYGKDVDPRSAAQYALDNGYKEINGGTVPEYFNSIFSAYGINSRYEQSNKDVINSLKSGRQVVMMGSGGSVFGRNPHYVVATGLDEKGNLIIEDPGSRQGALKYNKNSVFNKTNVAISAGLGKIKRAIGGSNPYTASYSYPDAAHYDLCKFTELTAADIDAWIRRKRPDSPFVGKGYIFIRASKESGLDPRYIVAHAATETGWGTSPISKNKHNYFGINAVNSDPYGKAYTMGSNMEQGIVNGANWIRKNYYNKGQKTVYQMVFLKPTHRYAVNDDGTPNGSWVNTISSIMMGAPKNSDPTLIDTSNIVDTTLDTANTTTTTETKRTPGLFDHLDNISTTLSGAMDKLNPGFDMLDKMTKASFGPLHDILYGKEEEVTTTKTSSGDVVVPSTSNLVDFFSQSLPGSRISSYYGEDRRGSWPNDIHHGTDFAVAGGTPILSPVDGTVIQSERTTGEYNGYGAAGERIRIEDNHGYVHCFFHLKERYVKKGDRVKRGDVIGTVGTTGNSSGNHLHYQLDPPDSRSHMSPAEYPYSISGTTTGLGKQLNPVTSIKPVNKLNHVETSIRPTSPQVAGMGTADSSDYSKFLATIIELLVVISKNSDNEKLENILEKVSDYIGKGNIDTSSIDSKDATNTEKLAAAIIKQQQANKTSGSSAFGTSLKDKDIQYIMSAMNSIARE